MSGLKSYPPTESDCDPGNVSVFHVTRSYVIGYPVSTELPNFNFSHGTAAARVFQKNNTEKILTDLSPRNATPAKAHSGWFAWVT